MLEQLPHSLELKIKQGSNPSPKDRKKLADYGLYIFGEHYTETELIKLVISYLRDETKAVELADRFKNKLTVRTFREIKINETHNLNDHELARLQSDYRKSFSELLLLEDTTAVILAVSRLQALHLIN